MEALSPPATPPALPAELPHQGVEIREELRDPTGIVARAPTDGRHQVVRTITWNSVGHALYNVVPQTHHHERGPIGGRGTPQC